MHIRTVGAPVDEDSAAGSHKAAEACPGADTLIEFVEQRAGADARGRVEAHVADCASCRVVLSALARSGTPRITPSAPPAPGPEPTRALAPGTHIGRYVITDEIGAGGMSVVYAARDPELGRVVAVKVLRGDSDPLLQDRLRREAQSMAQLAHPNVVAVYDVGTFDERVFIAMEHVAGATLARWTTAPRSPREILDAYRAAGSGLAAAHAAGIVHRDFKPENVLIGHDGRVRVGDFGLARPTAEALPGAATDPGSRTLALHPASAAGNLTAPGTLLGTPYYMAPELYDGAEASARSDQFSFCVALYTALYGERPFEDDVRPPGRAARSARLRGPRARSRVSPRIRAAIERGLSADPVARFASLDELLARLSPPPYRRARGLLAAGGALAIVAWLVARPSAAPDQRCTGAAAAFATAWNPERRGAIATAFAASRARDAAAALDRVVPVLDQYAARWTQAHTEACRATRILGEQTEAMLDLRMTCLERRRQEIAALVDALARPSADTVRRSTEAAVHLAGVASCADTAQLSQIAAPPADPASHEKLAQLSARLAEASARYLTGALAPALQLARPIAADAAALGYLPFQAEAQLLQGTIEYDLGELEHAEKTLEDALWAADAGRHDLVIARASIKLMTLIGLTREEFARGLAFAPRVTAVLKRINGDAQIESELERARAGIDHEQRNLSSALNHTEAALAIAQRHFGAEHLDVGKLEESLGLVLLELGEQDSAMQALQRALHIYEGALSPDHPVIGRTLHHLGMAHLKARDLAVAERELRRAVEIREAVQGPEHPTLPPLLTDLGRALVLQGRVEDAVSLDRRALAIAEKAFASPHLAIAGSLFELGVSLGASGHHGEAEDCLLRAGASVSKLLGPDHVRAMDAMIARGDLRMLQSRWRDAAALYERALPIVERAEGTEEEIGGAASQLARAYVELHQPARARALLERLERTLSRQPSDVRATADFALARARWDTGGDRAHAHELASSALAGLRGLATARPADVTQIERWLAGHPLTTRQSP